MFVGMDARGKGGRMENHTLKCGFALINRLGDRWWRGRKLRKSLVLFGGYIHTLDISSAALAAAAITATATAITAAQLWRHAQRPVQPVKQLCVLAVVDAADAVV